MRPPKRVVSPVLGIDCRVDDKRGGMWRRLFVVPGWLSTRRAGVSDCLLDILIYRTREIADCSVMLVSSEATSDMDSVEQPPTRRDSSAVVVA